MDAAESWMRDIPLHPAPILIASTQIDLETLKQAIKNAYDEKEDVNYVPEAAPTTALVVEDIKPTLPEDRKEGGKNYEERKQVIKPM